MSHSKRNTSRAVFTSYERSLAKDEWSASTARLTRDSFLPFAACRLCLGEAEAPVACAHGDIFCRECALANILAQRKEMQRLARARRRDAAEACAAQSRDDAEAQARAVAEFERVQMGLEARGGGGVTPAAEADADGHAVAARDEALAGRRGEKRKFELDEEELVRIAREDRSKARKAIDAEKASKPTLPSFWVPSVTPSSNTTHPLHPAHRPTKQHPICPASAPASPHPYSLSTLTPIHFTTTTTTTTTHPPKICPACAKVLSNPLKPVLMQPCGHVLCRNCVDRFIVAPAAADEGAAACYVCAVDLTQSATNPAATTTTTTTTTTTQTQTKTKLKIVDLQCEGTGFAAGGGANTVRREGVAFQC